MADFGVSLQHWQSACLPPRSGDNPLELRLWSTVLATAKTPPASRPAGVRRTDACSRPRVPPRWWTGDGGTRALMGSSKHRVSWVAEEAKASAARIRALRRGRNEGAPLVPVMVLVLELVLVFVQL